MQLHPQHGPLTRYAKLRVEHAPGIPGKFSLTLTSRETASYRFRYASRHVPWWIWGLLNRVGGKTFLAFPTHSQPAILHIWQEAHYSPCLFVIDTINIRRKHPRSTPQVGYSSDLVAEQLSCLKTGSRIPSTAREARRGPRGITFVDDCHVGLRTAILEDISPATLVRYWGSFDDISPAMKYTKEHWYKVLSQCIALSRSYWYQRTFVVKHLTIYAQHCHQHP